MISREELAKRGQYLSRRTTCVLGHSRFYLEKYSSKRNQCVHTLDSTYSWDLTTKYWLHCGTSSNTIIHDSAAPWYEFNTFEGKLPILRINTYGKEVSKHFKIKAVMDIVSDTDSLFSKSYSGSTQLQTNVGIKKRGRLSLYAFPKTVMPSKLKIQNGR